MPLDKIGQRCTSEREPELGLGLVSHIETGRIAVDFPACGEKRLYARDATVLKRAIFRVGETVSTRSGMRFVVESVVEDAGLLTYRGHGQRVGEAELADHIAAERPTVRLLAGQSDRSAVFDLRYRALVAQSEIRQSPLRGFLGGRIELVPHQLFVLREVATRAIPRVLLADEVGLGKTIEACLIVQRQLAVGRARRVLILVPEALVHQWFVELLRRFNLHFSIVDETHCAASEADAPEGNPFLGTQLALCSTAFPSANAARGDQAVAAGWDLVVVDEAHHLEWSPEAPSREYDLVERLARSCPGLLLLTATPMQLGQQGHFARLRLLDPDRHCDFAAFQAESEGYAEVAGIADALVSATPLGEEQRSILRRLFAKAPDTLQQHLDAIDAGAPEARGLLLRTLVDRHGPGRVMFRNTRAAMPGFPRRKFCPVPLAATASATPESCAQELESEESGREAELPYDYKDDPRIVWLAGFLRHHSTAKVLLICRSQRKAIAIADSLKARLNVKTAVFHEGLPLVQRDRQAAWFAEPDGARLLVCSEIGSEGRNFQFAHHLVLFDLPLNPGLVEQRIGRLDRIGQRQTIHIHVPYLADSAQACIVEWYHHGLAAFEAPLHGGAEYVRVFRSRLMELAHRYSPADAPALATLIAETVHFRHELQQRLQRGRDRLLELASFDRTAAQQIVEAMRELDASPTLRQLLPDLLEHFGIEIKELEEGDLFLDPSHAFVDEFSGIPPGGTLATFDRARALAREDIPFVTRDHPLVQDALDLILDSPQGTASFALMPATKPGLYLETVFVIEPVADSRWRVDLFLPPAPIRVVVDIAGRDRTAERPSGSLGDNTPEHALLRFLEQPHFNADLLATLVESATASAESSATRLRQDATQRANTVLQSEHRRLVDLRRINDHVRAEEITLAEERIRRTTEAIANARLRLDSVRLIVEGPTPARR